MLEKKCNTNIHRQAIRNTFIRHQGSIKHTEENDKKTRQTDYRIIQ